jgi:uncharacterized protein with gpF-like domain
MLLEFDFQQLPFDQAIEFLAERVNLDTDSWLEGQGVVQDANFTVAKAKGDLLQEIRKALDQAIANGVSVDEFTKIFNEIADRWADNWNLNGSNAWRSQLIYQTNLRTAYAAGRYNQMTTPRNLRRRRFWQWRHGGSVQPRLAHLALDGKVFEVANGEGELTPQARSFFVDGGMYPPIGFGCKCQVFSMSQEDLDDRGLTAEPVPQVGKTIEVRDERGIKKNTTLKPDKGFDFVPGQSNREINPIGRGF